MIAVTGATGQLGRLVINELLRTYSPSEILALVRDPAKAADFSAQGVIVREGDYNNPKALRAALDGADRLLLISSSEVGQRVAQHRNVIEAANETKVGLLVYTSLLHADSSPLSLAPEHVETEAMIRRSDLPFVILRNGWYAENYTAAIPAALANGSLVGCAGTGRISWAARADYAAAAALAVSGRAETGRHYELAGDVGYTLGDLAAEVSRQTGRNVPYLNVPEAVYSDILLKAGLPPLFAAGLAAWDTEASRNVLLDESRTLSKLLGRPTQSLADSVKAALRR